MLVFPVKTFLYRSLKPHLTPPPLFGIPQIRFILPCFTIEEIIQKWEFKYGSTTKEFEPFEILHRNNANIDLKNGHIILNMCIIVICQEVIHELNKKTYERLENQFEIEIIERTDEIIEISAKMIHKLTQQKELSKKYLRNQNIRIKNKGECECIAVAKVYQIPAVLLDQDAFRKLRRYADVIHLVDFGRRILTDITLKDEFLQSCHNILHI